MESDFEWVEARAACSPHTVFRQLELGAKHDVDVINAKRPETATEFEVVVGEGGNRFTVTRHRKPRSESVEFTLSGDQITVKSPRPGGVSLTATLTLNDSGECRLKVGNKELEQWQFRFKALENLLFDSRGKG